MTNTTLFAALHFEGAQGWWALVWLLVVVAGAGFLYWTYRGIFLRSERRLTWGLLLLRGAGLLLLVLMLIRPAWTRERTEVEPGRVALVVDNSRSMGLPDESGTTRYEQARKAAQAIRDALTTGQGPRVAVDLFDITGAPLSELPAEPTADATDLTRALRQAASRLRSRPIAGMVLISDGTDNTGRPGFQDQEDAPFPIHTLFFPREVTFDLAVREPQAPRRVLVHNELRVEVPVVKTGEPPTRATVSLRRGKEVLASQEVEFPAGNQEQVAALTIKPEQAGTFEITALVEASVAEKDTGNNAVNFPLQVVSDPIKVLYLEGFLRYEFKYLKAHLEEDPDISLVAIPRRVSPEAPAAALPKGVLTEEQLKNFDVILLGDMEGDFLGTAEYQAILKWLDQKNHSLLVLGGYHSFSPRGFRDKPIASSLPVVFATADNPQSETPFILELTDKGKTHPIFTVSSDAVRSLAQWKEATLEGMPLVQKARPGADVLAVNPAVQVDGQPAVAVAVQRAGGGGQVMVLCPDTTWRWSRLPRLQGQSDTLYSRFWSQTLRWLAGRPLDDQRPLLSVRTEKPIYDVNKKVTVRVTRQARPGTDLAGSLVHVEITDPKGKAVPGLNPRVDSADPDVTTVEFYPSAAGRYSLAAELKASGKLLANQSGEFRVRGADLEMADTSPRPANLQQISARTGGVALPIQQADKLPASIQRIERPITRTQRTEYWNSPLLFVGFLTLVAGEWFLRRWNHLV
jgi:hypothetical protein